MRCALTIAGSDSGGGAGIQADLKTFAAHHLYGASVITAVTAQNTLGVRESFPLPPEIVAAQLSAVLEDLHPAAIKIGMLGNGDIVRTVSRVLAQYPDVPVVLDPIMLSTSGHPLLDPEGVSAMEQLLFSRAALITPNLPEAQALTGLPLSDLHAVKAAAQLLYRTYGCGVLIKGGTVPESRWMCCMMAVCMFSPGSVFPAGMCTAPAVPCPPPLRQGLHRAWRCRRRYRGRSGICPVPWRTLFLLEVALPC